MSDWNYEILKYFSILPTIQDNNQNAVSVRMQRFFLLNIDYFRC